MRTPYLLAGLERTLATLLLIGAAASAGDTYAQQSDADYWSELLAAQDLTAEQRRKLSAAFEILTPLQETILRKHLRSINVVEELPSNAWTMFDPADAELSFRLVINAVVLGETLSEFATRKERELFEEEGSSLRVTVAAGSMDAVAFILLHEATHMVDIALGLSAADVGPYHGENLGAIPWRTGKRLESAKAPALYAELERTPFASVYASLSVAEDLAELVAWWQMTEIHGQPYRIELRDGGELIQSFEPMKSALVRSRLGQLARFNLPEIERLAR